MTRFSSAKSLLLATAVLLASAVLPAWSQDRIVLDGSSGMLSLARALATAYQQHSPDPRVEIGKGLGTGARLRALAENQIQIALASHGIERADVEKGNLNVIEVAKGAIVFAVNASVSLNDITEAQVCDIYSGRIRSWQALGGPDSPIVVLTRPAAEVDPEVIRARIGCFKELKEVDTARIMARGPDIAKALADTPHAIGMTSMTVVQQSAGRVKALTLNGVAPTPENARSGRYLLTRDFLFVTKGEPGFSISNFLYFVLSPVGYRLILANVDIPHR
jgi:phosphate transport system substrate-binding protein